jgi:hypothetical protein
MVGGFEVMPDKASAAFYRIVADEGSISTSILAVAGTMRH